jgi:hypothetical protein
VRVVDVEHYESALIQMIKLVTDPDEPTPNPSRHECGRCNIRREDCAARWQTDREPETVTTGAF